MKTIILLLLISFSLTSFAGPIRDRLLNKKPYIVHVPKSYDGSKPYPMILALHGGGGNMNIQANDEYYKLISKSESAGFIVVFPNGFSKRLTGKLATWNAGKCCGDARDKNIDHVSFIRDVIKNVQSFFKVDPQRIYAVGMSNGGMMSYRLACELSDVVKGIGAVAGTDNTVNCTPKNPISILHIHAKDDTHVLFNGGAGKDAFRDLSKVTDFVSIPETISKWVKLNQCHPNPKRVLEVKGAYCDQYSGCKNDVKVQLCVTETGGHSWPGGKKPRGGNETSQAISANDVIWDFFN